MHTPPFQYHVVRANDLTTLLVQEIARDGWTVNPDGFILLIRPIPDPALALPPPPPPLSPTP